MQLVWNSAEVTHRGNRRKLNEDAVLSRPGIGLWVVADGMGGHHAGDLASQSIVAALGALEPASTLAAQVDSVEAALLDVNQQLRLHATRCGVGTTIGSTVVAMMARGAIGVALWAGDSRLYRLRGERFEQITRDHNPVSDLLDAGTVTEAEAEAADTNIITRAVGGQPRLFLDVAVFDVAPEDTYLLCSDGLYRELDAAALTERLAGAARDGLDTTAEQLLAACLGGAARDNVSLVIARADSAPRATGAAS
ncbi:MAG: protein phosphatase 2C domain-containing protein [Pseudomonadales bacterium]